jgi:hypothetical protein
VAFARDTELALLAAVSLVSSAEPPDTLTSQAELERFWTRFGYTGRHHRDIKSRHEIAKRDRRRVRAAP